jgi:hypothetical protein
MVSVAQAIRASSVCDPVEPPFWLRRIPALASFQFSFLLPAFNFDDADD